MATAEKLSEAAKTTIANNANEWAVENYHAVERLRRNLLIACLFGIFVGLAGLKPERIDFLGIKLEEGSWLTFYIMSVFVTVYLYWSYYTKRITAEIHRDFRRDIYINFFGFEYFDNERLKKRHKFDIMSYRMYNDIIPATAAFVSICTVMVRMVIELQL